MKKSVTICMSIALSVTAFAQPWIRPQEAAKHIGDTVNVVGFVQDIIISKDITGSQTFLMLQGKDSSESLPLVVESPDQRKFKEGVQARYLNHFVQVKGKVDMYKGKPRIVLHSEKQISLTKEADMISDEPK